MIPAGAVAIQIGVAALMAIMGATAAPAAAPTGVPCSQAIAERSAPDARNAITLGRVALVPRPPTVLGPGYDPTDRRWPYSLKRGLQIRRGTTHVTISVPPRWQGEVRITFGYGVEWTNEVVFAGCTATLDPWLAYSGGVEVDRKACVPLDVIVGRTKTVVHMPMGKSCRG